jgi:hypothetical protein
MQDESGRQLSEDGHWWWDGAEWQPVDGQAQYSEQPAQHNASEQDPNERQVAFDPSDFPTLMLYAQFNSMDELATHLGIDVSTLQTDDDLPVV